MVSYRWHPGTYARNARYVADLATDVVALLAPQPCERILDLGCGDGALTERVGAFGSRVLGADANPEMVAAAKVRRRNPAVQEKRNRLAVIVFQVRTEHGATFVGVADALGLPESTIRKLDADGKVLAADIAARPSGLRHKCATVTTPAERFPADPGGRTTARL